MIPSSVLRTYFIAMEALYMTDIFVRISMFVARGDVTVIAVVRIEVIIDVALEVGGPVKPGSGTDEDTPREPFGTIVAVGSALIGSVIVVAIGADRSYSYT